MKKQVNIVVTIYILLGSVFFLTGCQKDDVIDDQSTPEKSSVSKLSDSEFQSIVSGKVIYPEDMELTDNMKSFLIERANKVGPINIEVGKIFFYSKEYLMHLDEYNGTNDIIEVVEDVDKHTGLRKSNNRNLIQSSKRSVIRVTKTPHYYEYDNNENPSHYGWCGHTALKCVAKKHGSFKTLQEIHEGFCNNSSAYCNDRCDNGTYCASLLDLYWLASNTNGGSWNYNFPDSSLEKISSLSRFYQRVTDGVEYNKPMVIPSSYGYGSSLYLLHFYPVVGYKTIYDDNGSIDYDKSMVYLRDVADPSPGKYYEQSATVRDFYNNRVGNQVLFVRP